MSGYAYDVLTVASYFIITLIIGLWFGRGNRENADRYFVSKGKLSWWVIGAAYVATGLNSEQLIGMNGMAYRIGLPLAHSYLIAIFVYTALIYIFFPLYLRNNIKTMPQYLGQRFNNSCQNVFSILLLLSYIFLSLAVVLYGGAKLFQIVFGVPIWLGVFILASVAGIYTLYGGMTSMISASVFQFILMFAAGGVLLVVGYLQLPNGWSDIVAYAPGGFHLMQPMDYPIMPWHAVLLAFFNLQIFYSCINQALVQRGFGAKTEWDVRMAIIFALVFVLLRPLIEILPGMIAKALAATGNEAFVISPEQVDNVYPMLIEQLIPAGMKGFILVGILASVMSTISAFLNSISTLITYDVYKKWFNQNAPDKKLVRVGMWSTFILIIFIVIYAPVIEELGGIFLYFQTASAYLAVPIATCFLFGMFWKKTTPAAALTVLVAGIPLAVLIHLLIIPTLFSEAVIQQYNLTNFYVANGISQFVCVILIIGVSFYTKPRNYEEISSLIWTKEYIKLPEEETAKPYWQSVWFWWIMMVAIYAWVYYKFW